MSDVYQEPESQDLGGDAGADAATEVAQTTKPGKASKTTAVTEVPAEPKYVPEEDVIGLTRLINAKGDAVTDVFAARVDRHLTYLSGKLGFKDDEARIKEQTSFMDSLGRTLQLTEFDKFVVVTDYVLNKVRENPDAFANGGFARFCFKLGNAYPHKDVETYKSYITLLVMIANNWAVRYKLNKMVDPAYLIKDLPKVAKQNITQYIAYLQRSV